MTELFLIYWPKGWQLIYDNSPRKVYRSFEGSEEMFEQNILGGEAAMWSEQVEGVAVEAKLWPRVAALGERLWADPESGNTKHWECHPDFLGEFPQNTLYWYFFVYSVI